MRGSNLTERVSAWGLAGWGTGDMTIAFDDGTQTLRRDLSMRLGALGARGALLEPGETGGMDLALKADALFVRTEWDRVSGETDTAADASRLRLVLEGGRAFDMGGGATFRPSLELGVRHDGGDAETGAGVEVGGGVSYARPVLGPQPRGAGAEPGGARGLGLRRMGRERHGAARPGRARAGPLVQPRAHHRRDVERFGAAVERARCAGARAGCGV